jgi:hypothetical protein
MTVQEFYNKWITVPRETEEICKFAEAYAKHENSYAILAIDEFKKENEDLQNQLGLAKSVEAELRKTIGKFKPLQEPDYEFAEAYAKQEIEAISRKEMMSIFSEYINDGNGAIEFHAEYSPKYPFYLISKENYNALQKQVDELKEAIEMARDELVLRNKGFKIDYPKATIDYLDEVLSRLNKH